MSAGTEAIIVLLAALTTGGLGGFIAGWRARGSLLGRKAHNALLATRVELGGGLNVEGLDEFQTRLNATTRRW